MQHKHGDAYTMLGVCLSVRPSVRHSVCRNSWTQS